MRIVFVTQAADPAHPVLAATLPKIRALASRVDEVVVIGESVVADALPANCRAKSFAATSQAGRGARYLAALAPELAQRPVAVVAHMAPVFAVLAAPVARPFRVPLLLWFTQQAGGPALQAAERVVDKLLTVDLRSVPLRSSKVRAIGHGIDVAALQCVPERRPPLRRLLGLGRYAPVKGWDTALRALTELPDATLSLHGPVLTEGDEVERPRLERLAAELGVGDRVTFGDEIPYAQVPQLFGLADALVNATRGNAADKVVYEAAGACLPVFAASPVFDTLLPESLRFHGDYPSSLAEKIRNYDGGAGPALRSIVEAEHSADHWAERVLEEAGMRAARPLRVARALPPAARRRAEAQVGCARIGRRPSRACGGTDGWPTGDEHFRLVGPARPQMLDGALFYLLLPFPHPRELRAFRPDAALVQGVHEVVAFLARPLLRTRADEGDPRRAGRLARGDAALRLAAPAASESDQRRVRAVRSARCRRGAHRVDADHRPRRVSRREPAAVFPSYVDAEAFLERPPAPLPVRPRAVFVGVLERYKAFDTLAEAWRRAAPQVPDATLHIVGEGTLGDRAGQLVAELPAQTEWSHRLAAEEVAAAMDDSWLFCLPSRSEGLPRVALEAACRGRAIVGGNRAGIPDVVKHE